ncbi:hypothetical protein ACTJJ0_26700 [Chitinophaga sp. 22321]|uniref:HEAT repeat domain-containing protein n=1 Tax=Chitinophaga hostae TaxID=2831022 RepID=A0ABS5J669_9BACT|nr:hypothetical protein [Chitinophaga hostae]MBS0030701.1 hypothetical protein [Chitinophaga hostae]
MKWLFLAVVTVLFSITAFHARAQQWPDFPDDSQLKAKEDYAKYESLVKDVADWLEETDLDKQPELRQEINVFILRWLTGSPNVTVVVSPAFAELVEKNPKLIAVYMARYASYCITNNTYKDPVPPTKAALLSIVKVCGKGIEITKTKAIKKLLTAVDENKLDEYIKKYMIVAQMIRG